LVGNHARFAGPAGGCGGSDLGYGAGGYGGRRGRHGGADESGGFDRSAAESVDLSDLGDGIPTAEATASRSRLGRRGSLAVGTFGTGSLGTRGDNGDSDNGSAGNGSAGNGSAEKGSAETGNGRAEKGRGDHGSGAAAFAKRRSERPEYAEAFAGVRGPSSEGGGRVPGSSSSHNRATGAAGAARSSRTQGASDLTAAASAPCPEPKPSPPGVRSSHARPAAGAAAAAGTSSSPEAQLDRLLHLELSCVRFFKNYKGPEVLRVGRLS
jgi:syndecan 1